MVARGAASLLVVAAGGPAAIQVGAGAEAGEALVAGASLEAVEEGPLQVFALAVLLGEAAPPVVRLPVREAVLPPMRHLIRAVVLPCVAFAVRDITAKKVGVLLPLGEVPRSLAVVAAGAGAATADGGRVLKVVRAPQGGRPPES